MHNIFARESQIESAITSDTAPNWKALSLAIIREKASWQQARATPPGWVPDAENIDRIAAGAGTELSGLPGSPGFPIHQWNNTSAT